MKKSPLLLVLLGFVIGSVLFGPAAYQWWTNDALAPINGEGSAAPSVRAKKNGGHPPERRGVLSTRNGSPYYSSGAPVRGGDLNPPIYTPEQYQPSMPAFGIPNNRYPSGSSNSINIGGYQFRNPDKDRTRRRVPYRPAQLAERAYSAPQWPQQRIPSQDTTFRRYTDNWAPLNQPEAEYRVGDRVQRRWDYQQPRFRPLDRSRQRYSGGINVGQPEVPLRPNEQRHLWTYENNYYPSADPNSASSARPWYDDTMTRY